MNDVQEIKGKCFCGGIQFQIKPPTKMFTHCHCESCRRSHGAAFVTWVSVDDAQFFLAAGEELVAAYESSPEIVWKFCKRCGTSLFQTTRHSPGITYIVAAALIDPMDRDPECHVSFEEKVTWLDVKDDLPKHREKTSDMIGTDGAKV